MNGDVGEVRLPWRVTLMAAALCAAVALPLARGDDATLLRELMKAFANDWLGGLVIAVVFGAPHGFALAVAFASRTGGAYSGFAVRAWVALLQTEVVIIGLIALRNLENHNELRAPVAIIGFALVSVLYFAYRVASPSVPPYRRDTGFFVRWGAMLVAGVFAWFELQWIGRSQAPGLWMHATLAAAFGLAAAVPKDR